MILLTFAAKDTLRLGVKTARGVLDLTAASERLKMPEVATTTTAFFEQGLSALPALQRLVEKALSSSEEVWLDEADLRLGPCVPEPGKILCVGLNYRKHAAESNMAEPAQPVLFSKFNNAVAAPEEDVPISGLEQVDYEAELGVVIGKTAKNVAVAEALRHVLGYCNANDLSERKLQFVSGQWLLGKTLDKFLPLGPYLVTADEITDPQALNVKGWLNGELRQDSSTADMIFSVAQIIAYASRYMTLHPGDLISTGTPEGVVLGMKEKVWLQPGDTFTVEIGPLGRLMNRMVE